PQGQLAPAPHAHGRGSLPAGERIPRLGGIIAVLGAALAFASIFLTFIDAPTGALSYQDVATLFGEQAGMPVGLATAMLYAGPVLVVVGVVLAFVSWRLHLAGSIVAGAGASAISFATMNWAIWLTSAGASTGFGIGVWLLLLGFIVTVAGVIGLAFKKF
ncbi:MAG: hypothetical protein Q4G64_06395, partial [bacterium]|nr:hypothetical protein [bacterium]